MHEAGNQADSAAQYARQAQILAQRAESCADAAAEAAGHYPRIGGGFWQVWDAERGEYVSTGVRAQGEPGLIGPRGDPGPGPNRNLLTNGYFVGGGSQNGTGKFPINQRGQATYSGYIYTIDRWRINGLRTSELHISLNSDCVALEDTGSSGNSNWLNQPFETPLPAGTYTLSILTKAVSGTVRIELLNSSNTIVGGVQDVTSGLTKHTITIPGSSADRFAILLRPGASASIIGVKLELGNEQTLAHQENGEWVLNELPDFGEELLSCQRYFQTFRTEALRPTYGADCRPVMAADEPTKGEITLDDVTYYTLTA